MNLNPKYMPFFARVWFQVNRTIFLLTIVIIPIIIMNNTNIFSGVFLALAPIIIILLSRSYVLNRYYLKSLEVNENEQYILLETVKYNRKLKQQKIYLKDVDVKISQVLYSLRPYYKLQIYNNKDMIFQQRECKEWTRNILVEIYDQIKMMKGQYSHKELVKP